MQFRRKTNDRVLLPERRIASDFADKKVEKDFEKGD